MLTVTDASTDARLFGLIARYYDRVFRFPGPADLLAALEPEPGDRILDVGGGTGRVSGTFGGRWPVVVCEPSPGMAGEAREKGLHVCAGVAERLPFGDGRFARIILVDTFHHLEDQRGSMRELVRVLSPQGRLVIEEPDVARPVVKVVALIERMLRMRSTFYSRSDMVAICQASGAEVKEVAQDQGSNLRLVLTRSAGRGRTS